MLPSLEQAHAHIRTLEHDARRVVVHPNRLTRDRIRSFWKR
jgi:hypothetical protein